MARHLRSNRRGEGTWRGQREPGNGPRLPALWDARGLGAGGCPVRPGVRRTGANRAERQLMAAEEGGEGRRTGMGADQATSRWPGPLQARRRTSHSIYLPGLDAVTPNVEPTEKARQE